jgi:hypothetical protein
VTSYIPLIASDEDVLNWVRQWTEMLADGQYQSALDMTMPYEGSEWTAERLQRILANYGEEQQWTDAPNKPSRLAESEVTSGSGKWHAVVYRASDEPDDLDGASVEFALPLNGAESDLNAHFEAVETADGCGLQLLDIRVD